MFFYPSEDKTYLLESSVTHSAQVTDLDHFQSTMCQILYVMQNKKDWRQADPA